MGKTLSGGAKKYRADRQALPNRTSGRTRGRCRGAKRTRQSTTAKVRSFIPFNLQRTFAACKGSEDAHRLQILHHFFDHVFMSLTTSLAQQGQEVRLCHKLVVREELSKQLYRAIRLSSMLLFDVGGRCADLGGRRGRRDSSLRGPSAVEGVRHRLIRSLAHVNARIWVENLASELRCRIIALIVLKWLVHVHLLNRSFVSVLVLHRLRSHTSP